MKLALLLLFILIQGAWASEKLIDKLTDLSEIYESECLPLDLSNKGFSEYCWKTITEIEHLENKLQAEKMKLEQSPCDTGDCKPPKPEASLTENELTCHEPKKKEIISQCSNDIDCALAATATIPGTGYLLEKIIPQKLKVPNCNLGDDSCATQLVTGFFKAAANFLEGAWDLLKLGAGKFWDWVKSPEDHSSTSQLALAKASEDPGVLDMIRKDFPGTMKKVWGAFVGTMKEWMKNDILCQKWQGIPHFSKCLEPTESFDCVSCKSMINGLCAVSGTIVAEVVPSFLTGGLTTAAKYGVQGSVKLVKVLNVSTKGIAALKKSRLAQKALQASSKVGLVATKVRSLKTLEAINRYLLSPLRKKVKDSFAALAKATKNGSIYVAQTATGKILIFGGKTAAVTGKALLYVVENPMTTWAYRKGERSFDKAFKLGSPTLASKTAAAAAIVAKDPNVESLLIKIEEAKLSRKPSSTLELEKEVFEKVLPHRKEILTDLLDDKKVKWNDILKSFYPELQYGNLAKILPSDKIASAEKELYLLLEEMPEGTLKTSLLKDYQKHVVASEARLKVVSDTTPNYKKIIDNSKLSDKDRLSEALKVIKRNGLSSDEEKKLALVLNKAHLHASHNGVFEYTWKELRAKHKILVEGGFTKDEAELLIRSGLAGRPPVRELIIPGETLFSGFASDILDNNYLEKRSALVKLLDEKNIKGSDIIRKSDPYSKDPTLATMNNVDALYFIDHRHTMPEFQKVITGANTFKDATLSSTYGADGFRNFRAAKEWLNTEKPEINKETFLELQKKMMGKGIDNSTPATSGKIRFGSWLGNVTSDLPIDEKTIKIIEANPYLTWKEKGVTKDNLFYGTINYTTAKTVKKEALDLIRDKHPELVKEIEDFQQIGLKIKELNGKEDVSSLMREYDRYNYEKGTYKLVEALVDDVMDRFNQERKILGKIDTPEKLDAYANSVAKFQRDLVSIHPLMDGNGRSTRELMNYALTKEGFPPSRIMEPDADMNTSLEDWQLMVKQGMIASDSLIDDLTERVKFGLPLENSLELLTPYYRPPVTMAVKNVKGKTHMEGVEYIDPRLYQYLVKKKLKEKPFLFTEIGKDPVKTWQNINTDVENVFTRNNIYYRHEKNGLERVSVNYVDNDFKTLYAKPTYQDKDLYEFKMNTWYSKDIIWRGLADRNRPPSEKEIVNMFAILTPHNASNAVLNKIRGNHSPDTIRRAAMEDFDTFNNDVFGDGLIYMAKDHSETGPLYRRSYGFSTSKNRDVGKAFAMGAMVIGEYGSHRAPELQALLKARILVGARKGNKDVDLGRLKQVREKFSYAYPRQQEVMGIGVSDPDSISIVQTIDAKGEVIHSYLRNPSDPKEIFVISGHIDPDALPTPEQIIKTIELKQK